MVLYGTSSKWQSQIVDDLVHKRYTIFFELTLLFARPLVQQQIYSLAIFTKMPTVSKKKTHTHRRRKSLFWALFKFHSSNSQFFVFTFAQQIVITLYINDVFVCLMVIFLFLHAKAKEIRQQSFYNHQKAFVLRIRKVVRKTEDGQYRSTFRNKFTNKPAFFCH